MTQTKKKPTSKKPPVKVQLSQKDLVELLTVVKNLCIEEVGLRLVDISHRVEMQDRRIRDLEKDKISQKSKRILSCIHEDRFESIWYSQVTNCALGLKYKCRRCGRERIKTAILLSQKEKRAIRKLGVAV